MKTILAYVSSEPHFQRISPFSTGYKKMTSSNTTHGLTHSFNVQEISPALCLSGSGFHTRVRVCGGKDVYSFVRRRFWQAKGEKEDGETELGQLLAERPAASVREAGCLRRDRRPPDKP